MPRKDAPVAGPISAQAQQDLVSEGIENFELPKSIVTKIAKSAIPENTKLQKDTILSLVKGSTVFINYLAATAHDVAVSKQHKSISASDVLRALEVIELGDLAEKLQDDLLVYRELSRTDKKKVTPNTTATGSASAPVPGGLGTKPKTTPSGSLSISIPASKLAKGKAKADPPASEGLSAPAPNESISSGRPGMDMNVDEPMGVEQAPVDGVEDAEDVQEEDDIEEDAPEELVDKVALEEEELRKDANVLDNGPGPSRTGDQDHEMD